MPRHTKSEDARAVTRSFSLPKALDRFLDSLIDEANENVTFGEVGRSEVLQKLLIKEMERREKERDR